MTRFLQLHLLTPYAAANLNRDDTGRPKTLHFGGAERLRISSQSLKRAFRTSDIFANTFPDHMGKRSAHFASNLIELLVTKGIERKEAIARVEKIIADSKLGKVKKEEGRTEQLVHLAPEEQLALDSLAEELATSETVDPKKLLVLQNTPKAIDIAMFGRMLADQPAYNVEASVQVAHAFTTHRVTMEDDFYTAVDDIKNADQEADRGAGFIGIQEYGAGLFYLYICINKEQLLKNLANDDTLAANAIAALIEAATTVSPKGKQNSYASRSRAQYALLEIGNEMPRSLAAAFQKPIHGNDQFADSVAALKKLKQGFERIYGEKLAATEMRIDDDKSKTLEDLITAARNAVKG